MSLGFQFSAVILVFKIGLYLSVTKLMIHISLFIGLYRVHIPSLDYYSFLKVLLIHIQQNATLRFGSIVLTSTFKDGLYPVVGIATW